MPSTAKTDRLLTVADVAAKLRLGEAQVLALINGDKLQAVNVGLGDFRPRWRITPEALDAFLAARASVPRQASQRRKRRRLENVTEYFT